VDIKTLPEFEAAEVPFSGGASTQQRMDCDGHATSSSTCEQIREASACMHTPGQSLLFAVLVIVSNRPVEQNQTTS
jgi:hypothetical protein